LGALYSLRIATGNDKPGLTALIEASIRVLGGQFYDSDQVESSLVHLFGVDSTMIGDGSYFLVEAASGEMAGAGGWSFRKTPFGGDAATGIRDRARRKPGRDAAIIRAFYVHPEHARKGVGGMLIRAGEEAATAMGFDRFELVATLSGIAFYRAMGYSPMEPVPVELPDGTVIDCLRMQKRI
jgi:GNAT superfamily N-acetyltransferase